MSEKEFQERLKTTTIKKINGTRKGWQAIINTASGGKAYISVFMAPDQTGKRAFPDTFNRLLQRLATQWGYDGSIAKWKK